MSMSNEKMSSSKKKKEKCQLDESPEKDSSFIKDEIPNESISSFFIRWGDEESDDVDAAGNWSGNLDFVFGNLWSFFHFILLLN